MFTTGGSVRKVGGVNQLSGFRYSKSHCIKYQMHCYLVKELAFGILNLCSVGAYEIFTYCLFSCTIIYVLIFLCVCNKNNVETLAGEGHARILRLGDLYVFKFTY